MLRRQVSVLLGFLLLAGGLGYGLVQLFNLRMASGDVFPEYSTLRADPLGTKVLLDSLNALPGLSARRNYRPLPQLQPSGPITLIYAGLGYRSRWEDKELRHFEGLVTTGSRAVFAFAPERANSYVGGDSEEQEIKRLREELQKPEADEKPDVKKKPEAKATPGDGKKPEASKKVDEAKKREAEAKRARTRRELDALLKQEGTSFAKVAEKWGFGFEVSRRMRSKATPDFTALAQRDAYGLEPALPWHSELHFKDVKAPWKTLYRMGGQPVVIERPWGAGSMVLASDSYFLSNEALYGKDRAPKLLAHLLGAPRSIVFDEEHLGVAEQTGIATLAQKYRLHGLVGGLLLVAALFIWQNIVRFVPPQVEEVQVDALVTGRGSSEGFLVLLRRSIPAGNLLQTCVAEWRRAFAHDTRALERLNATWPAQLPRKGPEIVAAYDAMARAVISKQYAVSSKPAAPAAPAKAATPTGT